MSAGILMQALSLELQRSLVAAHAAISVRGPVQGAMVSQHTLVDLALDCLHSLPQDQTINHSCFGPHRAVDIRADSATYASLGT